VTEIGASVEKQSEGKTKSITPIGGTRGGNPSPKVWPQVRMMTQEPKIRCSTEDTGDRVFTEKGRKEGTEAAGRKGLWFA